MTTQTSEILLKMFNMYQNRLYEHYSIKNDVNCSMFQSIRMVYSDVICYLDKIVEEKYKSDYFGSYYQNFKNLTNLQNHSFKKEDINDNFKKNILYSNYLSHDLQNFIQKICKILLDDININLESELTLIKYYWLNKFIYVYNELMYNQFKLLTMNQRNEFINEINIIIPDKFKIHINGISTYVALFYYYKNEINDKTQMANLILFINKIFNIIKYKFNNNTLEYNNNFHKVKTINAEYNNKNIDTTFNIKNDNKFIGNIKYNNFHKIKIINTEYNNKNIDTTFSKDDYVKICNKKNLNISIYQLKPQLEKAIFDSLDGNNLKGKAYKLGLKINNDVNENGIKFAIIEMLLNQ
jgi:hypothetical protein